MTTKLPAKTTHIAGETVTSSDANDLGSAINQFDVTAKGDIVVGLSAHNPTVLAVGTDGTALIADSTQSLGVKWGTPSAGATGSQGAQGPQGAVGSQGTQGPAGNDGAQGPQGPAGNNGVAGSMGYAGPQGAAATVAVGTVTTGSEYSSVTVANSGTSTAAVLDFTIPQGIPGSVSSASNLTLTGATSGTTILSPVAVASGIATVPAGTYKLIGDTISNAGSVTALSFIPTSSTVPTNGLYLPAANTIGLATNSTSRLQINSAGEMSLGSGITPQTGISLAFNRNMTGATNAYGIFNGGTVQSDVTAGAYYYRAYAQTQAASFTLGNLTHFYASQGTFGAGSSVTNQYGFNVFNTLTGATNNYGFCGQLAAATGVWNLYMGGTANNYMAGGLGIGGSLNGYSLHVGKTVTGATTAFGIVSDGQTQSDVTTAVYMNRSVSGTQAASFTLTSMFHYAALQGTIGAGSAITNQYGYYVQNTLTGATNNYGFYGDIASATGVWNLYMAGTANNYLAGALGIGVVPATATTLTIGKNITGSTDARGVTVNGIIQSDVTATARNFLSNPSTQAAAFTLGALYHFQAAQGTIGAGSAVTTQIGFYASSLSGATNNRGFQSDLASGTGVWNLYMSGTAANYVAGVFNVGTSSLNLGNGGVAAQLAIVTTTTTSVGAVIRGVASQTANLQEWQNSSGTNLAKVDASGNLTAVNLTLTGTLARPAPTTTTSASYSATATETYLITNVAGTCTVTLPTASTNSGRIITIKTITAQLVISASSNVAPLTSATAGTAILAATAGKWAELVSDGTNWIIMSGN